MILPDFVNNHLQNKLQNKKYEVTKLKWQKAQLEKLLEDLKKKKEQSKVE